MSEYCMGETCQLCWHYDRDEKKCTNEESEWNGKRREEYSPACMGFLDGLYKRAMAWQVEGATADMISSRREETDLRMQENVEKMGRYILQLGQLVSSMQRRMDELEKQQAAVTVRHEDVKRLQRLIRMRADEICGKYELSDRESPRIFRAAMKKDLLKRYGVKDLHDLPAAQLGGAENMVDAWTNIRMVMERRSGT